MTDGMLLLLVRAVHEGLVKKPAFIWAAIPAGIVFGRIASPSEQERYAQEQSGESVGDFNVMSMDFVDALGNNQEPEPAAGEFPYTSLLDVTIVMDGDTTFRRPWARLNLFQVSAWGEDRFPEDLSPGKVDVDDHRAT